MFLHVSSIVFHFSSICPCPRRRFKLCKLCVSGAANTEPRIMVGEVGASSVLRHKEQMPSGLRCNLSAEKNTPLMKLTIVHWLLDYYDSDYCSLITWLLLFAFITIIIHYLFIIIPHWLSLITLIHYHWWQTLFIVIWNITINWLLFIDYLTIMIDHSLLMIDAQLQYSRCVINNGEEWTQWWCNEVQWDNHEVIWTIVICNQEPTAIEWIVVDNKRQSRTNGELSIKWVIVNKHQVCNQDSTVDIMNQ